MERLVDAIREGEIIRMTELRAKELDLFILRRVEEHTGPESVNPVFFKPRDEQTKPRVGTYDEWKMPKPTAFYKRNNVLDELIENFHWQIAKGRKNNNLSRKQLAELIDTNEEEVRVIEMGQLPRDDFVLINKIERVLGINLRRDARKKEINLAELQKMSEKRVLDKKIVEENKGNSLTKKEGMDIKEEGKSDLFGDIEIIE